MTTYAPGLTGTRNTHAGHDDIHLNGKLIGNVYFNTQEMRYLAQHHRIGELAAEFKRKKDAVAALAAVEQDIPAARRANNAAWKQFFNPCKKVKHG